MKIGEMPCRCGDAEGDHIDLEKGSVPCILCHCPDYRPAHGSVSLVIED